jgi:REP element-mobilizing transposase RayT
MYAFVVMPEHVHLLFAPLWDANGERFGLAEIMSGIKGPSAHAINKLLKRRGHVWEEEYFDHALRKSETIEGKMKYIWENPVLAGLVASPADYPWLWVP